MTKADDWRAKNPEHYSKLQWKEYLDAVLELDPNARIDFIDTQPAIVFSDDSIYFLRSYRKPN